MQMGRGEEVLRQGETQRERTRLPDPGQVRKTEGEAPSPPTQGPREAARAGEGQQGPENLRVCWKEPDLEGKSGMQGKQIGRDEEK